MTQEPPSSSDKGVDMPSDIRCISIAGVKVHMVDMAATMDLVGRWIGGGGPHHVVTADASAIVIAREDTELRDIMNQADLVTPDGAGILLGSKWLGTPLQHRVSGVDIARNVCRMAAEARFSVFLFGAAPGIAEQAASNLAREFPGFTVAGTRDGFYAPEDEAGIVSQIRESGARALLVALGIPKQEKFIRRHLHELGVGVAIGVGGSLDVFSGSVKRAPEWMQRHGLEWAYRLAQNPRKISKVATLPRFVLMVLRERVKKTG